MRKMSLGIPQGKCPVLVKCTEVVWFGEMFFSEGGFAGEMLGRIVLGGIPMQDCQSLRAAIMTCGTRINKYTHIYTNRQID